MLKNNEFIDKLRTSGLRPTKQRLKICEVLFNREKMEISSNNFFFSYGYKGREQTL